MTLKKGYHRLIIDTEKGPQVIEGPLVCVFDRATGRLLSHHILEGEERMVEWVGGAYHAKTVE